MRLENTKYVCFMSAEALNQLWGNMAQVLPGLRERVFFGTRVTASAHRIKDLAEIFNFYEHILNFFRYIFKHWLATQTESRLRSREKETIRYISD